MICRGCGEPKGQDELASDTSLCYACEQLPSPTEESAFNAGVTAAQAKEIMDRISRNAAAALPLTATSIGRRIRVANREVAKDPAN